MSGKRTTTPRKPRASSASASAPREASGSIDHTPQMVRERGPRGWYLPILESAYMKLSPDAPARAAASTHVPFATFAEEAPAMLGAMPTGAFRSRLQPGRGEEVLEAAPPEFWLDRLAEYKRRKTGRAQALAALAPGLPPGPVIPGQRNWAPLGPTVVLDGQAQGDPPVAGRVAGIAIAPGGQLVYAASANGGVFRSDDGGISWNSLMDAFDLDPTQFASTSLACGAIAIDPADPNRIYVGTGEGDTYMLFSHRITNALPAYRGIGPIRSDDGGANWISEAATGVSPGLAGRAFFALAVDPANRENVVGATTEGLYQRELSAAGDPQWTQRRLGVHSSVISTGSVANPRFFAAEWGGRVYESADGLNWTELGTGFPAVGVGRIALGVQSGNSNLVYAMVADPNGALLGIYRYDRASDAWNEVTGAPDVLPTTNGASQGYYDLAVAVDPADGSLIYIGGSYFADQRYWPASIWRCQVVATATGYNMTGVSIGVNAHADVHVLVHAPGDSDALWVGCDGGVFLNRAPRGTGIFDSRNNGLACLCPTFFAQHPTDPNVMFCGLQDNGTVRTGGGPIWKSVNGGDGGYCLINWADTNQVLVFADGYVYRSTTGGEDRNSWSQQQFQWAMMTEPIVSPPYNPAKPEEANVVALGSGEQSGSSIIPTVFVSGDFGASWSAKFALPIASGIYALAFASADKLYVGTTSGEVFRAVRTGSAWKAKRISDAPAGPLGFPGLVADIAVDWSDPTFDSVYIAFGGVGDYRHVWHFDGTKWEARSGPAGPGADNLLDVEHNAIEVDRQSPANVYVGADIGVWHSPDSGRTWFTLPNGLPDAPVYDLQIHPTRRLLRAATHGRGLYELALI